MPFYDMLALQEEILKEANGHFQWSLHLTYVSHFLQYNDAHLAVHY